MFWDPLVSMSCLVSCSFLDKLEHSGFDEQAMEACLCLAHRSLWSCLGTVNDYVMGCCGILGVDENEFFLYGWIFCFSFMFLGSVPSIPKVVSLFSFPVLRRGMLKKTGAVGVS